MAGRIERASFLKKLSDADLKLLRIFIAIVESNGFAAAQTRLNMAPSLISENMKTLEIRLGLRLCERGPSGYRLLPVGKQVYESAIQLFKSTDRFTDSIAQIHDGSWGHLRLGIEDNIIPNPDCKVSMALAQMRSNAGGMSIQVDLGLGYDLIGSLINGKYDLVIAGVTRIIPGLTYEWLFDERRMLYCGQGHPLFDAPQAEVTAEQVSTFECTSNGQFEVSEFEELPINRSPTLVGHGADAHLSFALSGLAVTALPIHVGEAFVRTGQLRALVAPENQSSLRIAAISLGESNSTAGQRKFRSLLTRLHNSEEREAPTHLVS